MVLPRVEYERLMAIVGEALEDAEDVAIYDARKAEGLDPLPAEVTPFILRGDGVLRALRNYRNLTQDELADRAGITQGYLSDLEARRRKPSADVIDQIAASLDVPRRWLID